MKYLLGKLLVGKNDTVLQNVNTISLNEIAIFQFINFFSPLQETFKKKKKALCSWFYFFCHNLGNIFSLYLLVTLIAVFIVLSACTFQVLFLFVATLLLLPTVEIASVASFWVMCTYSTLNAPQKAIFLCREPIGNDFWTRTLSIKI